MHVTKVVFLTCVMHPGQERHAWFLCIRGRRFLHRCGKGRRAVAGFVQPVAVFFLALPMVPLNLMVNLMVYSRLVTLWLFNIAMENGPFIDGYLLQMVIFHGYVK